MAFKLVSSAGDAFFAAPEFYWNYRLMLLFYGVN